MELKDNVVVVTGGASGLGGATTEFVVRAGGKVVIADVQDKLGNEHAEKLGANAKFVKCDVTSEADGQAAIDAALGMGKLVGLVNCAGIGGAAKTVGKDGPMPLPHFTKIVTVNLIGTFNMIRLAAAAMAKNEPNAEGERGVCINTASVAAFDGQIGQAAYCASKGGIVAMTLPIARECADYGIRIATIAPGLFDTPLMAGMPPEVKQVMADNVPFPRRLGKPVEFARMAMHVIENPMLNGCCIRLDGALRMPPK